MLKAYYRLTKPGIIYGNALAAAAGFLLASRWPVDVLLFVEMLGGISLVIASACVINNYIDRHLDAAMQRTRQRALVTGVISGRAAIAYAVALGLAGFGLLLFTTWLTVWVALVGYVFYVILYGLTKRRSVHGTIVGSVSGAVPPVVGYTAVTGQLDTAAVILFLLLVFWQMPHFYAIAIFRLKDYAAAGIPVLPLKKGVRTSAVHIVFYIAAFTVTTASMTLFGYTGWAYLAVMLVLCANWLRLAMQAFNTPDDTKWARRMFGFSLVVLLGNCIMLSLAMVLP